MGHLKANKLQLKLFFTYFPPFGDPGRAGSYLSHLSVHQPEDRMWLVTSSIYTQQRPHMGQHRNADTISTRQNLSLETEQPRPRNPAPSAGLECIHKHLGLTIRRTVTLATYTPLLTISSSGITTGPALVRLSISHRKKKHLLGLSNSQLPSSCSTEASQGSPSQASPLSRPDDQNSRFSTTKRSKLSKFQHDLPFPVPTRNHTLQTLHIFKRHATG